MAMERVNSKIFTFLIGLSAILVATWAAVFSVTGLSMLYSGSLLYVAIAMGVLEFAKIMVASYLYRYWKYAVRGLKYYLSIALLVLMFITSGGIYGYLTNSYQGATIGLDKINSQSQVLDQRKQNLIAERERLTSDIGTLRSERQSTIDNRNFEIQQNTQATDSNSVKYRAWRNNQVHKRYNPELERINDQISKYTTDLDSTNVRLSRVDNDIADKKLEMIDTGVEVGPLVYMARIFNTDMDTVMKWFTLVIVFVFDPLAIALVVAYNNIVMTNRRREEEPTVESPIVEPDEEPFDPKKFMEDQVELEPEFSEALDEVTKRLGKDEPEKPRIETKKSRFSQSALQGQKLDHGTKELQKIETEVKEMSKDDYDKLYESTLLEHTKPNDEFGPVNLNAEEPDKLPDVDITDDYPIEAAVTIPEPTSFDDDLSWDSGSEDIQQLEPEEETPEFNEEEREIVKEKLKDGEIEEYFEDAVKRVKSEQEGVIKKSMFTPGGGIRVGRD